MCPAVAIRRFRKDKAEISRLLDVCPDVVRMSRGIVSRVSGGKQLQLVEINHNLSEMKDKSSNTGSKNREISVSICICKGYQLRSLRRCLRVFFVLIVVKSLTTTHKGFTKDK